MKNNKQNAFVTIFIIALIGIFSTVVFALPPSNDNWNGATEISGVAGSVSGTNTDATTQLCEPNLSFTSYQSVWYKWTSPETRSYTFRVSESQVDTTIAAFRMNNGVCLATPSLMPSLIDENAYFDTPPVYKGQITFKATAGQTIYFRVSPYDAVNPVQNDFTMSWGKTKLKYYTSYDEHNSGGDLLVSRTENGKLIWYGLSAITSALPYKTILQFGLAGDTALTGDYDGDGKTDMVAVRKENGHLVWWIGRMDGSFIKAQAFGLDTDEPKVGDFDGDGIADLAVIRRDQTNMYWHILRSSDNQYYGFQFGLHSDYVWIGDYDGDGISDPVVIRNPSGTYDLDWYIRYSESNSYAVKRFGKLGDYPQSADFDGDGKTDVAVFRQFIYPEPNGQEGNWYWIKSSAGIDSQIQIVKFGQLYDIPQALNMDEERKTSFVVYRKGQWWVMDPTNYSVRVYNWGLHLDTTLSSLGANIPSYPY